MRKFPADIVAVIKAVRGDPRDPRTFDRIVKGLLREIMRGAARPEAAFRAASARILDRDWPALTAAQRTKVIDRASKSMETYFAAAGKKAIAPIRTFGLDVAGSTRRNWKRDLVRMGGPVIGTALTRPDTTFVNQMAKTRGWYIKEHGKVLGDEFRDEAKSIIDAGAEAGLSGKQISKDLKKRMDELGVKQTEHYYRVVSDAAVSRSRTWSELSSFDEAGIESFRFAAILDERTSDVCFAAGTQIVTSSGDMSIENIRPGMLVLTSSKKLHQVLATSIGTASTWIMIGLRTGRSICVTPEHRLYVFDVQEQKGEWRAAELLKLGERLIDPRTGDLVAVRGMQRFQSDNSPCYNLEVETDPTYVAEGVLVHNCRFYHGKTWPVAPTMKRLADTERAAVTKPEAVKEMTPWIQKISVKRRERDPETGEMREVKDKYLAYKKGDKFTRVAQVKRSAEGQRDKIGDYKQLRNDKQLQADGAVQPPLHASCRSDLVPVL